MKTVLNDLESHNLTLTEAVSMAQNRPLVAGCEWRYALIVVQARNDDDNDDDDDDDDDDETLFITVLQSNELRCLTGHSDKVTTAVCTSEGTVCSASMDGAVCLWKPSTQHATSTDLFHNAEVTSTASSEDGRVLVTASRYIFLPL